MAKKFHVLHPGPPAIDQDTKLKQQPNKNASSVPLGTTQCSKVAEQHQ